jgi:hypothetical protein
MPRAETTAVLLREVAGAMLPGKASKLQVMCVRTPNRHSWSG